LTRVSPGAPSPAVRLRNFMARPMAIQLAQVTGGNVIGNALNLAGGVLVGWSLGKELFGLYGVLQGAMMLIAQLSDFGLNTTIVKYYRELQNENRPDSAEALLRRSLWLRIGLVSIVAGTVAALAGPIARHLMNSPEMAGLLRLACLGALGTSVWMFCQASMQARGRFGWYGLLTTANHALRLSLLVILFFAGRLNLSSAVVVLMAIPFFGSLGASLLWPHEFWAARIAPEELSERTGAILRFSKWIFLSTAITAIIMQIDRFLLLPLAGEGEAGVYQMANYLAQGFPLITAAVSTVFLPKLAATRKRSEMLRMTRYFVLAAPALAIAAGAVMLLAALLVPHIRQGEYAASAPVFNWMVAGFAISIIVNPLSFFCLAFDRAWWLTAMNAAQLVMNVALGLLLMPRYGALAAGFASFAIRLFALVLLALAFRRLLALAEDDDPDLADRPGGV
jgi:O-antigen/teichoic acid export membrane protein